MSLKHFLLLLGFLLKLATSEYQYAVYPASRDDNGNQSRDNGLIVYDVIRNGYVDQRATSAIYAKYQNYYFGTRIAGMWSIDTSTKMPRNLVMELIQGFEKYKAPVKKHFIKVTKNSSSWSNPLSNMQSINNMIAQGMLYGFEMGIYTSHDDWMAVTGNSSSLIAKLPLWYIKDKSTDGADTQPNFDDFVPFGPFTASSVVMKQFSYQSDSYGSSRSVIKLN